MNTYTIRKWRFALLVLVAVAAVSSCKKDKKIADPAPAVRPRLFSLEQDDQNYMIFGYTNKGYLNKFKAVNELATTEAHFTYDDVDNKLITGTWDGYELEFSYQNGLLNRIYFTPDNDNSSLDEHYLKFTYFNGRVSQTVDYVLEDNVFVPRAEHVYEYYANGDVKTQTYFHLADLPDQWEQVERNVYEYDDKVNATQIPDEVAYLLYMPKSAHNFKKISTYNAIDALNETSQYSYTYNKFGLPTTCGETINYPNSPTINRTLTYSYQ